MVEAKFKGRRVPALKEHVRATGRPVGQPASASLLDLRLRSKVYRRLVSSYRISEAANLSGLSRSSLRYYEKAGVLREPRRTSAGYRAYTAPDLDRLRFLARTRDLGLGLDEVRELLAVWDGGTCASAQTRLRELVAAKIDRMDQRVAEFGRLRAELQRAGEALDGKSTSGGCGPDCSCMTATRSAGAVSSTSGGPVDVALLTSRPPREVLTISCTLGVTDQHDRLRDWQNVLVRAVRREQIEGGVLVVLPADPALTARVAELVALEHQCCSFFEFTLTVRAPGELLLAVTAPPEALPLVHELLGEPA